MPKERRRAPKRQKNEPEELPESADYMPVQAEEPGDWCSNDNTPFGLVQPAVQSYFKEVDAQLAQLGSDEDEISMLVQAATSEIDGNELALATDPTCSLVLEHLCGFLPDKPLRVLFDRMSGSFSILAAHRYGSHVLQSILRASQVVIDRGEGATNESAAGVLRSVSQLVRDMFAELEPGLSGMFGDQFSSHVLRSIIYLLAGVPIEVERSKRSAKYRAKEQKKHAVHAPPNAFEGRVQTNVPDDFYQLLVRLYEHIHKSLGPDDVKRLVTDPVAAPTMSLVLRLESALTHKRSTMAEQDDSITAAILGDASSERSDYIESALRDTVASHVLESAIAGASPSTIRAFYATYIKGRAAKLGAHPCANYVVAHIVRVLPPGDEFGELVGELAAAGDQLVKNHVLGVLQACVERASTEKEAEQVISAVLASFRIPDEAQGAFVPVILSLRTYKAYLHTRGDGKKRKRDDDAPTMQGSLLLQKIAHMPSPAQDILYTSLAQSEHLIDWCKSSVAAHVIIAALSSPSATFSQRKSLLTKLLPELVPLCDDMWGSRVADAVWDHAGGFIRGKIADNAISHEKTLLSSPYGRFFVRRLRLSLYRRDSDAWREWAKETPAPSAAQETRPANPFAFLRTRKAKKPKSAADEQLASIFAAIDE
ncbi:Nucleolar protein 9 [Malassezia cuniculi]|uniref:Nucleolar protein 9 n=1 Tax=Malassezia cuniculi TaxID=948313 RepID=A0AAF0ES04_9BASI|nr:Nucleolar protein 9 [Malassezia cuniculi]